MLVITEQCSINTEGVPIAGFILMNAACDTLNVSKASLPFTIEGGLMFFFNILTLIFVMRM